MSKYSKGIPLNSVVNPKSAINHRELRELFENKKFLNEALAKVKKRGEFVIPAKAGIQSFQYVTKISGFPFARE